MTMTKSTVATIAAPQFGALRGSFAKSASARHLLIAGEVKDALLYIGQKSGRDTPVRKALESVQNDAPRGKNGDLTPSARRIFAAIANAMTTAKLEFSRLQQGGKLDADAFEEYAIAVKDIVETFASEAWPERKSSEKPAPSALDRVRAAISRLNDAEKMTLASELAQYLAPEMPETVENDAKKAA